MNVLDIKQQIKDDNLQSYYIFAGEEIEVQRIYINQMAEIRGCKVIRIDNISNVWSELITPSLFDEGNIYVVRDDPDLLNQPQITDMIDNGLFKGNILVHLLTNVDKRTKFYKQNADRIVVFEHLSGEVLKKYIRKQIALNNANCERLIAICENDYSRILLEIDKIKRFNADNPDSAFEELVENGTIFTPPQDAIFKLVDAILMRKVALVYELLEQCYAVGEANMVILSVLYTNAKQVLQVQSCESSDVCKSTGLTQWQVKCAKAKAGNYSICELVNMLRLIQKIQKGIITGEIEDYLSVDYLLVSIL